MCYILEAVTVHLQVQQGIYRVKDNISEVHKILAAEKPLSLPLVKRAKNTVQLWLLSGGKIEVSGPHATAWLSNVGHQEGSVEFF